MHPAPSVILFTVLSGIGFGLLGFLALGIPPVAGWAALAMWGLGYALAAGGLMASTFHLGNPQRALLAFTQWRTSWLSREAWSAVAALLVLAPMALSDWLGLGWPRVIGVAGAALAALTVLCTSMIYAQIAAVPRWRHWTTPALFVAFALTGGAILSGQVLLAMILCLGLAGLLQTAFRSGDGRFAAKGATLGTATGLDRIGAPSVFELPHTSGNYLLREMIFVVGRKHAARLRRIAVALAGLVPALLLVMMPVHPAALVLVALVHLAGAFAARWLFFAEAEHVVGLYYGQR
jgi:sulfite dehydrogenase (quinone) subunit SoeC